MRRWIVLAGLNAFVAVALGAFAAHILENTGDARAVGLAEKASRYMFWHALGLGLVGLLTERWPGRRALTVAGVLFQTGIVLFCGSLTLLALTDMPVAMAAPFGGTAFLAGWLAVAWGRSEGLGLHPFDFTPSDTHDAQTSARLEDVGGTRMMGTGYGEDDPHR